HERQPGQDRFEGRVTGVGGRHANVDVQPADALPARGDPGKADELLVARVGGDLLLLRVAGGMAAGSGYAEAVLLGNPRCRSPKLAERLVRPADRVADVGVELDDRREELGLEPPRQLELLRL